MSEASGPAPRAHGGPVLRARLRETPGDFRVEELDAFDASGGGEHLLLAVEKRALNTAFVARRIARWAGVPESAVGYAGTKDRHAVVRQRFTVHLPGRAAPPLEELAFGEADTGEGLRVLHAARHVRKLARGALAGNRFVLALRRVQGEPAAIEVRLQAIRARGVPNAFGSQRFGRGGGNVARALAMFSGRRVRREERSMLLSAARSELFNRVLAARVAAARAMAENNEPLPEPAAIGLAVPAPPARNTRPQQVEATALRPDDPWLEPAATHRIGVVIAAGSADRFQLPVELDITLPQPLVSQPVRVFQLDTGGEPREILAQLDQIASTGGTRLVLLVPGILPKDQPACVHVYLGLSAPPEPLPEAVHVDADEPGFVRLHNNAVQLLLGAEGAHVYGWQALAGDGRDLTMPGTDNWSGFSDLGGELRRAVNGVTCLADGPALARFLFTDGTHMEKTISLFGGCSWIEVMLSDPVGYYWDFDNPQNFAADGPTPGTYLFADGATGAVGREADGVPAQVKADGVRWGIKWNQDRLALGLITPEVATRFVIAPGAGAGGVGVEGTPLASHFITFAGPLDAEPAVVMQRLTDTLDLRQRAAVILYAIEARR